MFTGGRKMRVSVSPASSSTSCGPARRSCSTRRSTSSSPRATRRSARSSCSRRSSRAATGRWSSRTPTRSGSSGSPSRCCNPTLRGGDSLLLEPRSGYVYERIPKAEVEELILEEVPDIAYADIGGLAPQIEQIRDAIELPYLHADLFREHQLRPPKGVLLYGPPGCGKTLIAKAVANSLAKKVAAKTARTRPPATATASSRRARASSSTSRAPSC